MEEICSPKHLFAGPHCVTTQTQTLRDEATFTSGEEVFMAFLEIQTGYSRGETPSRVPTEIRFSSKSRALRLPVSYFLFIFRSFPAPLRP
jgi:hypothetical protein